MNRHKRNVMICVAVAMLAMPLAAMAQSSSLYVVSANEAATPQLAAAAPSVAAPAETSTLSPAIAATSFSAVRVPEPRTFEVQDLVTIIVRESTETDFRASLNTQKDAKFTGEITDFPRLSASDLLNLQLRPNDMSGGVPKLGVRSGQEFDGEGNYRRRESITARVTARIIDVKPNGTLVLEARKYIDADGETLNLVLTGTARAQDIGLDNTVLSSQLYDLHLVKEHTGELRHSTKKGFFTRVLETIFNF